MFENYTIFSIFENLFTIFGCLFIRNLKKFIVLKRILALPTWGQECLRSETELIEKVNFDLGHPVFPTQFKIVISQTDDCHLRKFKC